MDFIAVDFETANPKHDSACSMGITLVLNKEIKRCFTYLINPEQYFHKRNIQVHGITEADISEAPIFPDVWAEVKHLFRHYPVVAHNSPFEQSVLEKTARRYNFPLPRITYYDTLSLAQENFPALQSYKLDAVCMALGIEMGCHHQCDADSTAAANILLKMLDNEGCAIYASFLGAAYDPFQYETYEPEIHYYTVRDPQLVEPNVAYDTVPFIDFIDSRFVITGDIEGYTRNQIIDMIDSRGGTVSSRPNRKTRYVIIGMQDLNLVNDKENAKSTKICIAEELRRCGLDIKLIKGADFIALCNAAVSI